MLTEVDHFRVTVLGKTTFIMFVLSITRKGFCMRIGGILAITALVAATSGVAYAAGDVESGKSKAASCAACHGADGNSVMGMWPKLAGQHESYLAKQLADFKSGARPEPTMSAMVAPLADQDMQDIAAFYASQKTTVATLDAVPEDGELLYRGGNKKSGVPACMSCHGPAGKGNGPAGWPAIQGQHAQYIEKQLNDYKSATRANDSASMMRDVAGKLSDAEIKAVAKYVSALN